MNQTLQRSKAIEFDELNAMVEWLGEAPPTMAVSHFKGGSGVGEWHMTVSCQDTVASLEEHWLAALREAGIRPESTVMRRVFCSDVVNQFTQLNSFSHAYPGGFSAIGQTPLAGGCFAMWSYHVTDGDEPLAGNGDGDCFTLSRGSLRHVWMSGLCDTGTCESDAQTRTVLEKHNQFLTDKGMTLAENVVRTWWYVRDIDSDYQGLVEARREVFARHGLTQDTHYIASTGIAGSHHQQEARLSMDSYAISGLLAGQVRHLSAPSHLGPTHMYGVTFERATSVAYSDRKHIFLSGTASIDPSGEIVHPGHVLQQLDRTIENIEALLASAGAHLRDLSVILVYLRNPADEPLIERTLRQRFEGLPMIVLHAPVCRPGWLVEIEGIACITAKKSNLPDF